MPGVEPGKRCGYRRRYWHWRRLGEWRVSWGVGPSISVNMGQSSATKRTELARVLGEQEAIVQAAKFKNCPLLIRSKDNAIFELNGSPFANKRLSPWHLFYKCLQGLHWLRVLGVLEVESSTAALDCNTFSIMALNASKIKADPDDSGSADLQPRMIQLNVGYRAVYLELF